MLRQMPRARDAVKPALDLAEEAGEVRAAQHQHYGDRATCAASSCCRCRGSCWLGTPVEGGPAGCWLPALPLQRTPPNGCSQGPTPPTRPSWHTCGHACHPVTSPRPSARLGTF